jgi:hypothetical protein
LAGKTLQVPDKCNQAVANLRAWAIAFVLTSSEWPNCEPSGHVKEVSSNQREAASGGLLERCVMMV